MIESNIHHRIPRCILKAWDTGHGPGLEPEDLQAWFDWEEEAFRYGVDPDVFRKELEALVEGSTVEIPVEEHRAEHSRAGDFARWGRLGGWKTLELYGRGWFVLLGRRHWGRVGLDALAHYRENGVANDA